jgi:hypothetical protein
VHSASLVANVIERDSRVLFYPAEPAPDADARRDDYEGFLCHACSLIEVRHATALKASRFAARL